MDKKTFYSMQLDVFSEEKDVTKKIIRGRALLDPDSSRASFVMNSSDRVRSKELNRTVHSRLVKTPSGGYTLTFRLGALPKYAKEVLINEMREQYERILEDISTNN